MTASWLLFTSLLFAFSNQTKVFRNLWTATGVLPDAQQQFKETTA